MSKSRSAAAGGPPTGGAEGAAAGGAAEGAASVVGSGSPSGEGPAEALDDAEDADSSDLRVGDIVRALLLNENGPTPSNRKEEIGPDDRW